MIIDLILDRVNGKPYVPADFYRSVAEYGTVFPEIVFPITAAQKPTCSASSVSTSRETTTTRSCAATSAA